MVLNQKSKQMILGGIMAKVKGIWLKTRKYIECNEFEFDMYVELMNKKKSLKSLKLNEKKGRRELR